MTATGRRRICEFQLLRYVPDAVRNEYVHIGVILREQGSAEPAGGAVYAGLAPGAVPGSGCRYGAAGRMESGTAADDSGRSRRASLMRLLDESLSLNVQMTAPKAYLAESLPAGMEELMRLYVEPPPRERLPRLRGRAAIQATMRREFEQAGVWDLLRKQIRGVGVHAAGRSAADRCGIPAERGDSHVSRGEPGAGRGDGQGAGVFGGRDCGPAWSGWRRRGWN